jgi:hypothetical protein
LQCSVRTWREDILEFAKQFPIPFCSSIYSISLVHSYFYSIFIPKSKHSLLNCYNGGCNCLSNQGHIFLSGRARGNFTWTRETFRWARGRLPRLLPGASAYARAEVKIVCHTTIRGPAYILANPFTPQGVNRSRLQSCTTNATIQKP